MSELDDVYRERARLVAYLAASHPSVRAYGDPHEPEWSVVYVDTPEGQMSWHIAERDLDLFEHVEHVPINHSRAQWDGHSTEEKYDRLEKLTRRWSRRAEERAKAWGQPLAKRGEAYVPLAPARDGRRTYSDHRDLPTD